MLGLFRKKVKKQPALSNKLFERIHDNLDRLPRGWAAHLQKKTEGWSVKRWKLVLIGFCLVSCGATIYMMIYSVISNGNARAMHVTRLNVPAYTTRPNGTARSAGFFITESEYHRLQQIETYLDSLSKSAGGKATYDSIIQLRPGLVDSIRWLEELYLLQKK